MFTFFVGVKAMTIHCGRYRVVIVGADGLMHNDTASHPIVIGSVKFLLEKGAQKPIRQFRCVDTVTGKTLTQAQLDAISIF